LTIDVVSPVAKAREVQYGVIFAIKEGNSGLQVDPSLLLASHSGFHFSLASVLRLLL
jgi:hypothetical protein